ncbi:MarR family transcriptional regulator [Denitrobacterium detoxificans]|uniref:DNA-binding transcriptional regulator, MarR family n=1 Tax=Denitrobacterium detoxificans TaxID=79604 RepID=A0A172RW67_9ACTN|nr:MarR family transcriptional regulator [Denitrobacterium detoxificans]ANE21863.1 MarR family transcriptional regulator [Denitrobacterium detoxificans]SEO43434.1 DNA-binding transcriptional regulator, MarR family [Denitrobacterium detoxificans]
MAYDQLKLENQLCFPLYAAARDVVKHYKPHLDKLGITYTQYITLMVLWEQESASVKQLGQRLHLDSGTLTPLCKKLESKGLVERVRDKRDERNVIVKLTAEGRAMEKEAAKIPNEMSACVPLTKEEASTLYSLLYKTMEGLDASDE